MKMMIQVAVAMASVFVMTGCGGGTCERIDAANKKFLGSGKTSCSYMSSGATVTITPSFSSSSCNSSLSKCTSADMTILDSYTKCIEAVPACATGSEKTAADAYTACVGQIVTISGGTVTSKLSADCANGFK
ncbi:MAG: hypothetical protein GQE15_07720 [Archangiaceae bacterium]|nr:hypothetical protein [Archangiaceae bacterium]